MLENFFTLTLIVYFTQSRQSSNAVAKRVYLEVLGKLV